MNRHVSQGAQPLGFSGVRRHASLSLLLSLAVLLVANVAGAKAAPSAESGYGYLASFGSGELGTFIGSYNAIAIDGEDNIVVADGFESTAKLFAPDPLLGGTPLTSFSAASIPIDLAVDPSTDAAYFANHPAVGGGIVRYLSDGAPVPAYSEDTGYEIPIAASALVVDPVSHDLLVAEEGAEAIKRFDDSGTLLGTISTPGVTPQRLALAPDGSIYAAQEQGAVVYHFASGGNLLGELQGAGPVSALAVNPLSGALVVDTGASLKRFSAGGTLESESRTRTNSGRGLVFDGSGERLYEYIGDAVDTYVRATVPGVEPPSLSDLAPHSVHLSAEVDPGVDPGGSPGDPPPAGSFARFEYSEDGGQTWVPMPDHALSSSGVATIEDDLQGLEANSPYLARLVAGNAIYPEKVSGTVAISTVAIVPDVETRNATDVTETSAVLNGTIDPNGLQTTYHFEYGTSTAYGSRIPVGIEAVADGSYETRFFSRKIAALAPGVIYHFRIVAQNSIGTSFGADDTFTTTASGAAVERGYEQVTPVDKKGRPINAVLGFQARADGSAFIYNNLAGALDSPLYSFAASYRDGSDWHSGVDLSVPLKVPSNQEAGVLFKSTLAVSPDLSRQLVATNRQLTPEGTEGWTNLYIQDIATGAFTFVGSNENPNWVSGLGSFDSYPFGLDKFLDGSSDFSWVLFKSVPPLIGGAAEGALYRWSEEDGLEVVSVVPGGSSEPVSVGGGLESPVNWASSDGSRIYFQTGGGIYLREGDAQPRAISVSQVDDDPAPVPVPGIFLGADKDGRYAFFIDAGGPLTADAVGASGNVYRYDAATGSLEFIDAPAFLGGGFQAMVGVSDDGRTAYFRTEGGEETLVWRDGVLEQAAPSNLEGWGYGIAQISPNGRFLTYEEGGSSSELNNFGDVYLYDADAGTRACVSCQPDGSEGEAFLPTAERSIGNRSPRVVTDAGQVFFTAPARLVAADANARQDVYMFQDGRTTLITPGDAPYDAVLADVSEDGSDVFFSTNQELVGQDNDDSPDIYDARIGGGLPSQSPPPPEQCLRDDCKATPGAGPELPFGGSEALTGPGNVKPAKHGKCGKGKRAKKVKGKVRCLKKHAAKKHRKKANTERRQSR
jgi:hypothetical protein